MSSPEHKQKIWNMIKDIRFGMLVTNEDHDMHGRPMAIVQDEYDGTLWFFTRANDAKVREVREDRDVCLTFSNPGKEIFVSLSGKAKLTKDQALIDKYWNPYAEAWFKGGKDDPEVAMLEIKINKGEHWKSENKMIEIFEVMKANIMDEETPDFGENKKFGHM